MPRISSLTPPPRAGWRATAELAARAALDHRAGLGPTTAIPSIGTATGSTLAATAIAATGSGPTTEPTTGPAIEVRELRKVYGAVTAVESVSFSVEPGTIFGILGPNGAGKSTTVECIVGLRTPDGGRVSVLGRDPIEGGPWLRERVGVQLQESRLPDRLRVGEAMALYASFYEHPADGDELLERLGLAALRNRPFAKLSGGEQQRLSIALALVGRPRVAVLDELTTGLDPQARREIWGLIEELRAGGVTVLLVTHFMDEAERLCDRVALIAGGRVTAEGTPAQLAASTPEHAHAIAGRPTLEDAYLALTTTDHRPARRA